MANPHPARDGAIPLLAIVALAAVAGTAILRDRPPPSAIPAAARAAITTPPVSTAAPVAAPVRDVPTRSGFLTALPSPAALPVDLSASGWIAHARRIVRVELRIDGVAMPGVLAPASPLVVQQSGLPADVITEFSVSGRLPAPEENDARRRAVAEIVAVPEDGAPFVLVRQVYANGPRNDEWSSLADAQGLLGTNVFHILPGASNIIGGGAAELAEVYAPFHSRTVKSGMRVPILYMRTTLGRDRDFVFDPRWDTSRKCGDRIIAEDSLDGVIEHALRKRVGVLFTLNGGVWSDATCDATPWDVVDHLENDVANCQWNQFDEVMPDNALKELAGGHANPELARMLTYNVYATANRHYKRRNLQAAALRILAFAREHPDLFIGISLDPDTTQNPFFSQVQWYDYNPDTLRQFRHWLAGTGPYAGKGGPGVPDLSAYRRAQPLTLAQVRRISGRPFARWEDVDPPRAFPQDGSRPFWRDVWHHEWDVFRRHLIDLHYDELSKWLAEVGVPRDRIFSGQGLMAPHDAAMPLATYVDSPTRNYDSGGVSIEGAVPSHGHLGVVVYGPAASNQVRMDSGGSLFATFKRFDPRWGIVEANTSDLRKPAELPGFESAYRMLRDAFNYGATFVSPMAWTGSNGIFAGQPGYVTYMAWRNTPFEDAMFDLFVTHADFPLGGLLWTFGGTGHASTDDWTTTVGMLSAGQGSIRLTSDAEGRVVLLSPGDLAVRAGQVDRLVLGVAQPEAVRSVAIEALDVDGRWRLLAEIPRERFGVVKAGVVVPLGTRASTSAFEQLRVTLRLADASAPLLMRHVALYPAAHVRQAGLP